MNTIIPSAYIGFPVEFANKAKAADRTLLTSAKNCRMIRFMANRKSWLSKAYLLTVDGAALTKARCAKEMSLEDVVQGFSDGVNISTVSRWEQGKLMPSPERLWKLIDLYGTNDFVRLNGRAVLTAEEIEVVRKLREG
jgi:hypothetical protein